MNRYLTITLLACATGLVGATAGCDNGPKLKSDEASHPEADNTRKNARDTSPVAVTPLDQSETPTDRAITQKIRQAIVKDDQLSMNAKNVKIVTSNGVVTLRGPVETPKERDVVASV
ncbi:MAG TPA: BON domain-containing protein, partial [Byssovorax sp.]